MAVKLLTRSNEVQAWQGAGAVHRGWSSSAGGYGGDRDRALLDQEEDVLEMGSVDREYVREVQLLSVLNHKNVVKLLGVCHDGGVRGLVYRLFPGGTLHERLHGARRKRPPPAAGAPNPPHRNPEQKPRTSRQNPPPSSDVALPRALVPPQATQSSTMDLGPLASSGSSQDSGPKASPRFSPTPGSAQQAHGGVPQADGGVPQAGGGAQEAGAYPPLGWEERLRIAVGVASAMAYLHEDARPRVIHRDVKTANVLLAADGAPAVADFGSACFLEDGQEGLPASRMLGTFGYVDPEYAMTGHVLARSDVYSFGVVLLELLSGKLPVDHSRPAGSKSLVDLARPLLHSPEGHRKLADPLLGDRYPPGMFARVAAIASMCVQPEAVHRPEMGEVRQALRLVLIHSGALASPTLSASSPATFSLGDGDPPLSPATGATGTPRTLSPGVYHAHAGAYHAQAHGQGARRHQGPGGGAGPGGFSLSGGRPHGSPLDGARKEGGGGGPVQTALHKSGPLDPRASASLALGPGVALQGPYHTFAGMEPNSHAYSGASLGPHSDSVSPESTAMGRDPSTLGEHSHSHSQAQTGQPTDQRSGYAEGFGQAQDFPWNGEAGYALGDDGAYPLGDAYPLGPVLEEEPTGWKGCALYDTDAEGNAEEGEEGGVPRLLRMQLHGLDYSGCQSEVSEFVTMSPGSDYPRIGYTHSSVLPLPTTPEKPLTERYTVSGPLDGVDGLPGMDGADSFTVR